MLMSQKFRRHSFILLFIFVSNFLKSLRSFSSDAENSGQFLSTLNKICQSFFDKKNKEYYALTQEVRTKIEESLKAIKMAFVFDEIEWSDIDTVNLPDLDLSTPELTLPEDRSENLEVFSEISRLLQPDSSAYSAALHQYFRLSEADRISSEGQILSFLAISYIYRSKEKPEGYQELVGDFLAIQKGSYKTIEEFFAHRPRRFLSTSPSDYYEPYFLYAFNAKLTDDFKEGLLISLKQGFIRPEMIVMAEELKDRAIEEGKSDFAYQILFQLFRTLPAEGYYYFQIAKILDQEGAYLEAAYYYQQAVEHKETSKRSNGDPKYEDFDVDSCSDYLAKKGFLAEDKAFREKTGSGRRHFIAFSSGVSKERIEGKPYEKEAFQTFLASLCLMKK